MGFEIPEPFVWDESFKVFYENLDTEHKGLFVGVFDVAKSPSCPDALTKLKTVIKEHFENEEGMMKSANYGEFQGHKKAHDEFVSTLNSINVPVPEDKVAFAKDWLVNHIKGVDFKYKGKL